MPTPLCSTLLPSMRATVPAPASRRQALARLAWPAAALALPMLAGAATPLRPTPAQTEGPFYPLRLPTDSDHDLLRNGPLAYSRGQACWLDGTVSDLDGKPLAGAVVEIWQCDAEGHYQHPGDGNRADPAFQAFGRVAVDAAGRYRFRTLRPVPYTGRTPHIHVKVRLGRRELLTTQLYVDGEPGNARDGLWRSLQHAQDRAALTRPFKPVADGQQVVFPIVVAA